MINKDQIMDIKLLKQQGLSIRQIARQSGLSRNTVRKLLRGEHPEAFQTPQRGSRLHPFHHYLRERFEQYALSATRLYEEIRAMGYAGSASTVRRYVQRLKETAQRRHKTTVRFETPPGKQAQADWAECGKVPTPDGKSIAVYAFIIVLSHSRKAFVRFTTSMKLPELIESHRQAFAYFGGWTETILYDNMKQVRVGPGKLNEQFLDFAKHYGFTIKTHRPYRARTKGKVERLVDYVKDNFLAGRTFKGIDDMNAQVMHWLEHTANARVHGTTGQIPEEVFQNGERAALIPLDSVAPYHYLNPVARKVNFESMVSFQGSRYSVPPEWVGREVLISADAGKIAIYADNCVIAEHQQALRAGQSIVSRDHLAELWKVVNQQLSPPPRHQRRFEIDFSEQVEHPSLASFEAFVTSSQSANATSGVN
ncbi:MAG TPA: IS21 family transposase [Pirellulaceae bacterium]|nr:IS21 family transposase [Pirellulaceae bacterium]